MATRGKVGIETKGSKLRLRLPREVATGISRYISTGLDDNLTNLELVSKLAKYIDAEIEAGSFDVTLERYTRFLRPTEKYQTPLSILEVWDRYCGYMESQLAVTTYRRDYQGKYRNHISALPYSQPSQATDIRHYLVSNKSLGTAKRVLMYLNACYNWAVESGIANCNPFSGMVAKIHCQGHKGQPDPFSYQERELILRGFQGHPRHSYYYPLVRFLFLTGCRPGEAVALKWSDISPNLASITFQASYDCRTKVLKGTKTNTVREFPCNDTLQALLRQQLPSNSHLVFPGRSGSYINLEKLTRQVWKGNNEYRGIVGQLVNTGKISKYRPLYNTRHTFITMSLEKGIPVTQVARWVGNSPEVIFKHYSGVITSYPSLVE